MVRTLLGKTSPRDHRAVLALALLAYASFSALDWMTTITALHLGGRERNPIALSLYERYGAWGLLAFKALVVTVIMGALLLLPRRLISARIAIWVATAFAAVTALAVLSNLQALTGLADAAR